MPVAPRGNAARVRRCLAANLDYFATFFGLATCVAPP